MISLLRAPTRRRDPRGQLAATAALRWPPTRPPAGIAGEDPRARVPPRRRRSLQKPAARRASRARSRPAPGHRPTRRSASPASASTRATTGIRSSCRARSCSRTRSGSSSASPRRTMSSMPTGAGSLALGCSIGFNELLRAGEIDRLPRLLVVQPEHCSPLARAFAGGQVAVVAGRTGSRRSPRARRSRGRCATARCWPRCAESGGTIVAVAEEAIAPAVRTLAAHGLYAEPDERDRRRGAAGARRPRGDRRRRHGRGGANGFRVKAATAMAGILDR